MIDLKTRAKEWAESEWCPDIDIRNEQGPRKVIWDLLDALEKAEQERDEAVRLLGLVNVRTTKPIDWLLEVKAFLARLTGETP